MAKDFARSFYKSKRWQHTREAYARSVGGLCERCLARGLIRPGVIVHHKVHLDSADAVNNPALSLSWDNLELLCRDCHAEEHKAAGSKRFTVDEFGRVKAKDSP